MFGGGSGSAAFPIAQSLSGTPQLIQSVASNANPVGVDSSVAGNNYTFQLPNSIGAGNCIVLAMTYPHGSSPTITDNNGNSWPGSPSVSADAGSGKYVSGIFVLPNANAGATTFVVAFGSAVIPFQYNMEEWKNVATVSPVNGTVAAANVAAPNLATGSFTPGNNNANGGNVICSYFAPAALITGNPTKWVSGGTALLVEGDIGWDSNNGFPHGSQYQVQTTSASINPAMTATGDTVDTYNCLAIALKAASAGTSARTGICIAKINHFTVVTTSSPWVLQIPATGNLRVLTTADNDEQATITGITDSDGNTWVNLTTDPTQPQTFYCQNQSPSPNLIVTCAGSFGSKLSMRFYDITGAAASSFDVTTFIGPTACNNQTSISNFPDITPTHNNGLVIACAGLFTGPGLSVTSPIGATWDLVTYTNEIDDEQMENADLLAHYYNPDTTALNFAWTFTSINGGNAIFVTAAAFH